MKLFLDLLFPPLCLHCDERTESSHFLFCRHCIEHFMVIDPSTRCKQCFSPTSQSERVCTKCRGKRALRSKQAAVFEPFGPVKDLQKALLQSRYHSLEKLMAGYFLYQFTKLEWPYPEEVIAFQKSFRPIAKWLTKWLNQTKDHEKVEGILILSSSLTIEMKEKRQIYLLSVCEDMEAT